MTRGIYIHIPFCERKCAYCDFYSQKANESTIENYVANLIRQITASDIDSLIKTIYIGGGTPSVLTNQQLINIVDSVRKTFHNIEKNAEFTIEVNPESVTRDFIKAAKSVGINRVSIGVQSLQENELVRLGRTADVDTNISAYNIVTEYIDNVSLDLMLAIPEQSILTLQKTLNKVVELNPKHISAYLLKVEENTLFYKQDIKQKTDDEQCEFYLYTSDFLVKHGYEHYEISSFAKKGYRSKHNMSYWQQQPYFSFGAGSYGFDGKTRYHYSKSLKSFNEKIIDQVLSDEDLYEENIMLGLRTSDGVFLSDKKADYADTLISQGYMKKQNGVYKLTPKGFLVSNEIIVRILER